MKASHKKQPVAAIKQAESVLGPEVKKSNDWLSMKEILNKISSGVKTSSMVF